MKVFNHFNYMHLHKDLIVKRSTSYMLAILLLCLSFSGCNNAEDNNNRKVVNTISVSASPTISDSPVISAASNTSTEKSTIPNEAEVKETVPKIIEKDYSDSFLGIDGCAVFYNSDTNEYNMYNQELCEQRISPCSTFKIITTIMGLEQGILTSADSTMSYNGTIYSRDQWNKDLSLVDAFKESCVWYFKKVIDQIGQSKVQSYLDKLEYGNSDISEWDGSGINSMPELNGFWLESSLEISPKEQVNVLASIFNGKTEFSKKNIDILKEVMLTQKIGDISVYGKTGTGQDMNTGHRDNGWFVGMLENIDERYYFAVHISDDKKEVAGAMAKEIALDIINKYYVKEK